MNKSKLLGSSFGKDLMKTVKQIHLYQCYLDNLSDSPEEHEYRCYLKRQLKYKFEALEAMTNAIAFFARIKYKYVKTPKVFGLYSKDKKDWLIIIGGLVKMHSCKKCLHCECRKSNKSGQNFYYCGHPDQKYIHGYFKCHDLEAKLTGFIGIVKREISPDWCPFRKRGTAIVVK